LCRRGFSAPAETAKLEKETREKMKRLAEVRAAMATERQVCEELRYTLDSSTNSLSVLLHYVQSIIIVSVVFNANSPLSLNLLPTKHTFKVQFSKNM
jgi:predicted dithiol-disulfide oxidoreductase (DUF899 family)